MGDQLSTLMRYWPILMMGFAGVSSGFAFYNSMQNLSVDVLELKQMLVREERIELELKLRDTEIDQLKGWMRLQEALLRDLEDDVTEIYRMQK